MAGGVKIAVRLRILVFTLVALMFLIAGSSYLAIKQEADNVEQLAKVLGPLVDANNLVYSSMVDADVAVRRYAFSSDKDSLAQIQQAQGQVQRGRAQIQQLVELKITDDDSRRSYDRMRREQTEATAVWFGFAAQAVRAVRAGNDIDTRSGVEAFDKFRLNNAELDDQLNKERAASRARSLQLLPRGGALIFGILMLAVATALIFGRRVSQSLTGPLDNLRSVVDRQSHGDSAARAQEDQGVAEVRSLAADFNKLSDSNAKFDAAQRHVIAMRELESDTRTAIRAAGDVKAVLEAACRVLGEGLGVQRVFANTLHEDGSIAYEAQWADDGLELLTSLPDGFLRGSSELTIGLWDRSERLMMRDLLSPTVRDLAGASEFASSTGARAIIVVPVGVGQRMVGGICVAHTDGPRRWSEVEGTSLQQAAVYVAQAVVGYERGVEQARYVERLEMLDVQKTDFLSTVSHELRTPLTSIGGYLELLQDGDAGELNAEQSRMLEVIERNSARLRGLIEDILVLNRIEAGRLTFSTERVHIGELVAHTVEELAPVAARSGVVMNVDSGPPDACVDGDRGHLQRAVVNVLSNAIKFSPAGGEVELSCMVAGDTVAIICRDHGIGIPAADMDQMFGRFFRARNASAQAIQGTGLGLAIVKAIVEDHGGTLGLQSVEGEGTTITLEFPLASDEAESPVDTCR